MRICRKSRSMARRRSRSQSRWPRSNARPRRRRSTQRPPRRPRSMPRPRNSTTRATTTFSPSSAPRPRASAAPRSSGCRRPTTSRSTSSSCNSRAYPTIPRHPIRTFTSAANTPTCKSGSTASSCPRACPHSARSSTPISSAKSRSSPARYPREYGLRTAGVLDITSRSFATPGGEVSLLRRQPADIYAEHRLRRQLRKLRIFRLGARQLERSGTRKRNADPNAIHDFTQQGKFFGYASSMLDEFDALERDLGGVLQPVPDTEQPGQPPIGDFGPASLDFIADQRERDRSILSHHGDTAEARHRRRRAIRGLFALCPSSFSSRRLRRSRVQRSGLQHHPAKHC